MSAAYHPAADGQSEKTNDTIKVALRCLLVGKYEEKWLEILPEVEFHLNFLRNIASTYSPFEVVYG